jgi:hypothetical protein
MQNFPKIESGRGDSDGLLSRLAFFARERVAKATHKATWSIYTKTLGTYLPVINGREPGDIEPYLLPTLSSSSMSRRP